MLSKIMGVPMPALSEKQRRAAYAALEIKKKGLGRIATGPAAQMARGMNTLQLEEFTVKKPGAPFKVKHSRQGY